MPEIELAALLVGDAAAAWADIGFVLSGDADGDGDAVHVSGVRHAFDPSAGRGVIGWSLRGVGDGVADVDGLSLSLGAADAGPTPQHPNGVVALDHVVLVTPDLGRTIAALEGIGLNLRRVREAGRGNQQAFFKLGDVVLEAVGPAQPRGDGPPRFYGLAWTVRDLDETAAFLGERLRPAKDAVQQGRRIATLDRDLGGSTVSMAFMSAA